MTLSVKPIYTIFMNQQGDQEATQKVPHFTDVSDTSQNVSSKHKSKSRILLVIVFAFIAASIAIAGFYFIKPTTCTINAIEYQVGDTIPALDGCNTCSCTERGEVVCTLMACDAPIPVDDILDISNNMLNGTIPSQFSNLRTSLSLILPNMPYRDCVCRQWTLFLQGTQFFPRQRRRIWRFL